MSLASAHVFHYRSPRHAARSLIRDRRRLERAPGLIFHRLVFIGSKRSEGFNIGPVDPRRQLALCLWQNDAALARFKRDSPIARAWRTATDEHCEVRMTPFRAHGSYHGVEPLAGLPPGDPGDAPVAMMTFAAIAPRHMWFFWSNIVHARRALVTSPGLIAGTAGPEHLYRGAMTFTIWERLEAATGFSYREQPHKGIVKEVKARDRLIDSMFIRMRVDAAEGSWPAYSRFAPRFTDLAQALAREQATAPRP
jgi:hypothetical protein